MEISSRLQKLSLGCCEDLCQFVPQILQSKYICPNNVELLGLASMKDDPGSYLILDCDPSLFQPFTKLQVLYFVLIVHKTFQRWHYYVKKKNVTSKRFSFADT